MSLFKFKYLSLKIKIFSLFVIVFSMVFLIFPIFAINLVEKEMIKSMLIEIDKKIETISKLHNSFLKKNDTSKSLTKLVQLENYPYILSCSIYDKNGNLFSEYKKNTKLNSISTLPIKNRTIRTDDIIEISRIIDSENKPIGLINILLTTHDIKKRIAELEDNFLIFRLILFSIMLMIIFIVLNSLFTPLSHFNNAIISFLEQNKDKLDFKGNYGGEVQELSTSFIAMNDKLIRNIEKSKSHNKRYETILNTIPYGVSRYDKNGLFLFGNESFYKIMRNPNKNNFIGSKFFNRVVNENEREGFLSYFQKLIENSEINSEIKQFTTEIKRYDNTKITVHVDWQREMNIQGKTIGFIFITTDITKDNELKKELDILTSNMDNIAKSRTAILEKEIDSIKKKQSKIIQEEKLTALGSLVSGVAHEINTPLGVGISLTSNIIERSEDFIADTNDKNKANLNKYTSLVLESTSMILKNLNKVATHVKQFKTLAIKKNNAEKKIFNVSEALKDSITPYEKEIKDGSHKVYITCDKNLELDSFYSVFTQLISTLLKNSITHGFDHSKNGVIKIIIKKENEDRILLKYYDNGIGVPDDKLEKIFEPFYTTKRGEGFSGLGLYTIYNLITGQLKGTIEIDNTSKEGLGYKIEYPL